MGRGASMTRKSMMAVLKEVRALLESLGPAVAFRKLHGILNALEMQVDDGRFQRHAVTRLCEALLLPARSGTLLV